MQLSARCIICSSNFTTITTSRMSRCRKIVLLVIVNASLFITTFLNEMVITIFPAYKTNQIVFLNGSSDFNDSVGGADKIDNSKVASLLGIKYATQIVAFPVSGMITDQRSPGLVMLVGLILESVSYFFYCASESFTVVCVARFIDGVGSAFYNTAALTLIYVVTPSNKFRNKLITINSICAFVAISAAPLVAGASYQYTLLWTKSADTARWVTFSIIGPLLILITIAAFPFASYSPSNKKSQQDNTAGNFLKSNGEQSRDSFTHIGVIVKDPYILINLIYLAVFSIPLIAFQATLPTYMHRKFGSDETMQGVVWFGCMSSIPGFLFGSFIYHKFFEKCWFVCLLNLQIVGFISMAMAFVQPWWTTSIILGIINFSGSVIEVILIPFIAVLIDKRYTSNYGGCSSLTMLSYTLSGVLGTFPAGVIVEKSTFSVLCYILALLCIPLSPMIVFCRKYFSKAEESYTISENEVNERL